MYCILSHLTQCMDTNEKIVCNGLLLKIRYSTVRLVLTECCKYKRKKEGVVGESRALLTEMILPSVEMMELAMFVWYIVIH